MVWKLVPQNERLCQQLGSCFLDISLLPVFVIPLILTAILYSGPLVVLTDTYTWTEFKTHLSEEFSLNDVVFIRNYIVAPVSEDYIFRAVMVCLLREVSNNYLFLILASSLVFSLAHSHHYFFQRIQGDVKISEREWVFQMTYTFLFGCYCCLFYLKTGSFLTPALLHAFCNFMGFPDLDLLLSNKRYFRATVGGFICWILAMYLYI